MIKRIFTVRVDPSQRAAFERDFNTISVDAVKDREGFISVEIGKPARWNSDDYVMISTWKDEESLGPVNANWNITAESHFLVQQGVASVV